MVCYGILYSGQWSIFTVTDGNEARVGLVLIQSFLFYYVNHEAKFALEKGGGFYQKKVTVSLMFSQG